MATIEVLDFSEENLAGIMALEEGCFPESWLYDDMREHYADALRNPDYINIGLRDDAGQLAGYLLAVPHDAQLKEEEFLAADPEYVSNPDMYYVETAEIREDLRQSVSGGGYFFEMLEKLFSEGEVRFGVFRFSTHARVTTRLSRAVQRAYGSAVTCVRRIDQWAFYNNEEPVEYIEVDVRLRVSRRQT